MEELIFFAVLILFSILETVARKRKQQQGEVEEAEPADAEVPDDRWEGLSTYETTSMDDPDGDGIPGEPLSRYTRAYGEGEGDQEPTSSDELVPGDIWEEIGALARGERTMQPEPEPEPAEPWASTSPDEADRQPARVPTSSPIHTGQVGRREVGSRRGAAEHPIHGHHADYGTDPSERAPVAPPTREGPSREVRAVRKALVEGGRGAARRAVILHEVLGAPLAYRGDEGGGGSEV